MRFGKGLSTLKNCTVTEGSKDKKMENNHGLRNEIWKEKEKEKKYQKR
jgi:hypothetical protein|tara:strand:+ start:399 stop:542 length:144 start_codon:yes stop_codon:yes gene_type:complete